MVQARGMTKQNKTTDLVRAVGPWRVPALGLAGPGKAIGVTMALMVIVLLIRPTGLYGAGR